MIKKSVESKIISYSSFATKNIFSARRALILFTTILLFLISVSSVMALTATFVSPGASATFEYNITKINVTTDFAANCSYNISDGTNPDFIATLLGNETLNHSADNVNIQNFDDGTVTIDVYCWNITDDVSDNTSRTITKATDAPQFTWNNPTNDDTVTPSSSVILNITTSITGNRDIDQTKTDVFDVTDCGGSLVATPSYSCETPANTCNVTQTWNVPAGYDAGCNITANVTTSLDSIDNQSTINVSVVQNTKPNVTFIIPATDDVHMYQIWNFTVEVNDSNTVSSVTIWNGTDYSPMALTGGTTNSGNWSLLMALSSFADGTQTITVNATNIAGGYNDTTTRDIVVDNSGPYFSLSAPANNTNTSDDDPGFDFYVYDDLVSGNMNCTFFVYNSTGDIMTVINNASVPNNTIVEMDYVLPSQDTYTWNVTCDDDAWSNVLMGQGNSNSSDSWVLTYDYVGPVNDYVEILQPDQFVSGAAPNNVITLEANYTDEGTGVAYVTANFTAIPEANETFVNMTYSSGVWIVNATVSDTSSYEFESKNISLMAYDYAGNPQVTPAFEIVVLYNMTLMPGDDEGCGDIASGSTDFSIETDWSSIDLLLLIDLNYSTTCDFPPEYADNQLHRVARFNFSDINLTTEQAFQQLGNFMDSIDVEVVPDGAFGDSRIYLNSSALTDFNRIAILTLYNLPFDSIPEIIADVGAAGVNESLLTTTYETYTSGGVLLGNLTFAVNGFSGYNVSDTLNPYITVNSPAPNMSYVGGNVVINVTVNGTGTQVSNVTIYLDGSPNYMSDMTCYNATGSEEMNCHFSPIPGEGQHVLNIYAWDYGGVAPGNTNSTIWNFTVDTSGPSVTNNQSNITGIITATDSVLLNVTATDMTNVSNVTANGVLMGNWSVNDYNLTTRPNDLGCTGSGVCTVVFNATDYHGNYNSTVVTQFTVDIGPPSVTGVSVTNATNVTTPTVVNIQAVVLDPANVSSVTANGLPLALTSGDLSSGTWSQGYNASDLGCASDATCTITINASDTLSNYNDTETTSYYVDDTPPLVIFERRNMTEAKSTSSVQINVTVHEGSAIASVTVGNTSSTAMSLVGTKYSATFQPAALGCAEENCSLSFTATDAPGNVNDTVRSWIVVDDTAPVIAFTFNSTNLSVGSSPVTLNVTVSVEANTMSSITAGGLAMTQIGSTNDWYITNTPTNMGCSEGICTITFRAYDLAGNMGTTTTTIEVDNSGPATSGASSNATSNTAQNTASVNFTVTVTDANTVASVDINGTPMTAGGSNVWWYTGTPSSLGCSADSTCELGFNATDSLGNENATLTLSFTTDDTGPTNTSNFVASAGGTTASITSAFGGESVKCTVIYGTNDSVMGSTATSGVFSTNGAVSLTGLSMSTTYYYNVTQCVDQAGNIDTFPVYGPFNFTTTITSTSSGGGGGGGGAGYTTYNTGDLTRSSSVWSLGRGDRVSFKHSGEDHLIKLKTISSNYAVFELLSDPQELTLHQGESKDVDLNDDGKADINLKLEGLTYYKAEVLVKSLVTSALDRITLLPPAKPTRRTVEEASPEAETVEETVVEESAPAAPEVVEPVDAMMPPEPETVKEGMSTTMYVIFGILALIVVGALLFFLLRKKQPGSTQLPKP